MSEIRPKTGRKGSGFFSAGLLGLSLLALPLWGAETPVSTGSKAPGGRSPMVLLSDEFFQTMENLARTPDVYGDRQEQYLAQIAAAQRFLVKSHFALLEQNEKILRLLEEISRQGRKASP